MAPTGKSNWASARRRVMACLLPPRTWSRLFSFPRARGKAGMGAGRAKSLVNDRKHLLCAHQHVVIPEAQHTVAAFMQAIRTRDVTRGVEVLTAVHFDDQLGFEAREIHDIWTDRKLAPKSGAKKLPAPQMMP